MSRNSFKDVFKDKDWWGPLADTVHTLFLLMLDTIEIAGLLALAWGLKLALSRISLPPLIIGSWEITSTQIIKNFDYGVLAAFLIAQAARLLTHLVRKSYHG